MEDIQSKGEIAYHLGYLENYYVFITLYLSKTVTWQISFYGQCYISFFDIFYFFNKNINNKILNINIVTSERSLNIELLINS